MVGYKREAEAYFIFMGIVILAANVGASAGLIIGKISLSVTLQRLNGKNRNIGKRFNGGNRIGANRSDSFYGLFRFLGQQRECPGVLHLGSLHFVHQMGISSHRNQRGTRFPPPKLLLTQSCSSQDWNSLAQMIRKSLESVPLKLENKFWISTIWMATLQLLLWFLPECISSWESWLTLRSSWESRDLLLELESGSVMSFRIFGGWCTVALLESVKTMCQTFLSELCNFLLLGQKSSILERFVVKIAIYLSCELANDGVTFIYNNNMVCTQQHQRTTEDFHLKSFQQSSITVRYGLVCLVMQHLQMSICELL